MHHNEYWGTRQQLLAGKVIADFVDKDYGPLDPVFGVLLCPVAGCLTFYRNVFYITFIYFFPFNAAKASYFIWLIDESYPLNLL